MTEEYDLMVVFQNISESAMDGKWGITHVPKEAKAVLLRCFEQNIEKTLI